MANILSVEKLGNSMIVRFDDTTQVLCVPTPTKVWLPRTRAGAPGEPVDPTDPPDNPGNPGTGLYNPYAAYGVTGTWEDHASYSQGGIDRGHAYGTPLKAPAAGTIIITRWVDAAGRTTVFQYDNTYARVRPASTRLMNGSTREAQGPMVSLVLQHQSAFVASGHYEKDDIIGYSGASANPSSGNYGGDVHLHYHGLDASGARLDHDKFY